MGYPHREADLEIRRFFLLIRKWFWLILLGVSLVSGFTYLISRSMTPVYEASAVLLDQQVFPSPGGEYAALMASQHAVKTYTELAKSAPIMSEVASTLGSGLTVKGLQASVSAVQIPDTELLRISALDANPEVAKNIANTVAAVFTKRNTEMRQQRFEDAKKELDRQIGAIEKDIESTQAAINALGDPKDPKNIGMPEFVRSESARLENNLIKLQTQHTVLLKSAEDFRMASARYSNNLVVSSLAEAPRTPVRPKVFNNTILAGLAGLVSSLGLVYLLEHLDDTVKSSEDVLENLGLSTLGNLGKIRGRAPRDKLIAARHPKSPLSEGYRTLRTNLQFSAVDNKLHTLLVTSPSPGEGKSMTSANLALVMAQSGLSVVLVDSDLRRPTLHKVFDLSNSVGLTSLLMQDGSEMNGSLQNTPEANLRLLASGPLPPNPSELLGSKRMRSLMERLRGMADIIILDSPPMLAVTDASILAREVDGVLLVLEANTTRRDMAVKAKEDLKKIGGRILGVALNKIGGRGSYYYHYHYYSSKEDREQKLQGSAIKSGWSSSGQEENGSRHDT